METLTIVTRLQRDIARARRQANAAKDSVVRDIFLSILADRTEQLKRLMEAV